MGNTLKEIAENLKGEDKRVQLIYAFNGSGKTRLSKEFKELIVPKNDDTEGESEVSRNKILYYNAFTEDLFFWDNDLEEDTEPKLRIQPNTFTDWLIMLLKDLGEDGNIVTNFQRYTDKKITPNFNEEYKYIDTSDDGKEIEVTVPALSEVTFQIAVVPVTPSDGNTEVQGNYKRIKTSKGEESNFIWSIMYTLLDQIVSILNESDETNRITDAFNQLEYVFIDDPVTSLDENHLIELAVDLAHLIKSSTSDLKFIITTHSPLFYNVLYNELNNKYYKHKGTENQEVTFKQKQAVKYRLSKNEDGSFQLDKIDHDSPFSYHLYLLSELQNAIRSTQIKKYHFNFLRNILEKTSTFLGYERWQELLEKTKDGNPDPFADRIINISSHSKHSGDEVTELVEKDKEELVKLVDYLIKKHSFWQKKEQNV